MVNTLTEELRTGYAPNVPVEIAIPEIVIPDILDSAAQFYPDRIATDFLGATLTYHQLRDQVLRAAQVFADAGVGLGDTVAFVMPNCPQHVVAFYGVSLVGGVVAEHNPLAPAAQLEQQILAHGATVIVAWEKSIEALLPFASRHNIKIMSVNLTTAMKFIPRLVVHLPVQAAKKQLEKLRPATPLPGSIPGFEKLVRYATPWTGQCPAEPANTAVLLHTGGTTGTPKAVELTHRNLVANTEQSAAWVQNLHEGAEVFAATLPFFHAFGMTLSLLAAVRMAATVMIFPTFDESMILGAQQRRPITFFPGVAPMFDRLYQLAVKQNVDMSSIRFSLSGAMALNTEIARKWEELTHGYIIEGYGMTEGSPILLGNPVSDIRRPGTLGVPYPSTEVRIVNPDNRDEDMPNGEPGEILCRGPQVFKGYLHNPEETAATLWKGWLCTGDIGYVDNGIVVMADRKKELIISGGFNVYPSQVEEVVRSMPGIEDVAVVGLPSKSSGEQIVAAIVLDGSSRVDIESVRAWAEKQLSHYALPKRIEIVSELPRSQVGKVLRRVVREQLMSAHEGATKLSEQTAETLRGWGEQAKALADQLFSEEDTESNDATSAAEPDTSTGATDDDVPVAGE